MAIAPISSVSFRNNYNQVNFEGKKEKKSSGFHVPAPLKAIPLATAIAMSPMVKANAQGVQEVSYDKVVSSDPSSPFELYQIYAYDADGDPSTIETVAVVATNDHWKGDLLERSGYVCGIDSLIYPSDNKKNSLPVISGIVESIKDVYSCDDNYNLNLVYSYPSVEKHMRLKVDPKVMEILANKKRANYDSWPLEITKE